MELRHRCKDVLGNRLCVGDYVVYPVADRVISAFVSKITTSNHIDLYDLDNSVFIRCVKSVNVIKAGENYEIALFLMQGDL